MENKEILKALGRKRKVSEFARFINVSTRTVYNILSSGKPKDSQYYMFTRFLIAEFTKEPKKKGKRK